MSANDHHQQDPARENPEDKRPKRTKTRRSKDSSTEVTFGIDDNDKIEAGVSTTRTDEVEKTYDSATEHSKSRGSSRRRRRKRSQRSSEEKEGFKASHSSTDGIKFSWSKGKKKETITEYTSGGNA